MRALVCREWGPVEALMIENMAKPAPGPHEMVLAVKASAVNFADSLMVQGKYQTRPEFPFAPGLEAAGTVLRLGESVTRFRVGDRVMAMLDHSGFAEQVLAQGQFLPGFLFKGLFVDGRQPIREGAAVVDDSGATIGTVTSGGFSPTLQRPIAMAYVPMELSQTGTAITVEQRGRKIACTVADMPFVPHHYHRKSKP